MIRVVDFSAQKKDRLKVWKRGEFCVQFVLIVLRWTAEHLIWRFRLFGVKFATLRCVLWSNTLLVLNDSGTREKLLRVCIMTFKLETTLFGQCLTMFSTHMSKQRKDIEAIISSVIVAGLSKVSSYY